MRSLWNGMIAAGIGLCCFATAAPAAYLVVPSGGQITVFKTAFINPDCSSLGQTTINLTDPPHGGEAGVIERRDYIAFVAANPRSACNRRRIATTQIVYRANRGFVGTDTFGAEIIGPTGVAFRHQFQVEVR